MADDTQSGLRDRIARQGEDALGKLAQELLENPLVNSAIARAFEAREKAVQAQEAAMGALNIPSAADIERLTRRLRSVSQRMEGIEEAVDRLDQRLAAMSQSSLDERLAGSRASSASSSIEISHLAAALDAAPAASPREQERLKVDERSRRRPPQATSKPAKRKRLSRDAARAPPRPLGSASSRCAEHATRAGTPCTHARPTPRRSPTRGRAPRRRAPLRRPSDVGRRRSVDDHRRRRPAARSAASSSGSGASGPSAPSARLVPSCGSDGLGDDREPSSSTNAPHVPTRTSRRAPSAISSSTTIAALGPPRPVLWIVIGAPSAAMPV